MNRKINWKLQGDGIAYNLSVGEGIVIPTLEDYEKYLEEFFKRDEKLICEDSPEAGDNFLLYDENLKKIVTFSWKGETRIVTSEDFKAVLAELKLKETKQRQLRPKNAEADYRETIEEAVQEMFERN